MFLARKKGDAWQYSPSDESADKLYSLFNSYTSSSFNKNTAVKGEVICRRNRLNYTLY